jgi:cystathionine beta-lyase
MTDYRFDQIFDRRPTSSTKWNKFPEGVLPFWVADMDMQAPAFLLDALKRRIDHGILGYTTTPPGVVEAFMRWLDHHYRWQVEPDWLVWIPGVVTGFNLAARAALDAESARADRKPVRKGFVIPRPVYYPFLDVAANAGGESHLSDLVREGERFVMDFDDLDRCARKACLFMLCNPQNPTGRVYERAELERVAELCLRHDLTLMSDEIHCPVILDRQLRHIPVATLSPEIETRTVTLFSPTKAYNFPGLGCAVAVIPDPGLRRRFLHARADLVPGISPLAYLACESAWSDRSDWLPAMLEYLRGNAALVHAVAGRRMTPIEGTYLAWIDVRDLRLEDANTHFEKHGLGLSVGEQFGGPGFVRFNFGCPRSTLEAGLVRLSTALAAPGAGVTST